MYVVQELQTDPPDAIIEESRQVAKSIFAIADIMKNVGETSEVGFQPCVVIMLEGLESRDPPLGGGGSDSPGALDPNVGYRIHF